MPGKFDRSLLPAAPDLSFETDLWSAGHSLVAGIDEAGRGALAGPVSAGVVILPAEQDLVPKLNGVRDSKEMTPNARKKWAEILKISCLDWGIGFSSPAEVDNLGIVPATRLAVERALAQLRSRPDYLLVDYLALPNIPIPQIALVKGDARCLSIAAASILAKTARDALMCQLDEVYPAYGFTQHKGYGTSAHRMAIQHYGISSVHRTTFKISGSLDQEPEA